MSQPLPVEKLNETSECDCPCGCGAPAFMYTTPGLDGYVDVAPHLVQEALADALEDQG